MTSFEMKVLNDGNLIPGMGFGTYKLQGEECSAAVESAIQAGYRLFDTAEFYQNEESVGLGIKKAGLPREEVFIAPRSGSTPSRRRMSAVPLNGAWSAGYPT